MHRVRGRVMRALEAVVPFLDRHALVVDSPHDGLPPDDRAPRRARAGGGRAGRRGRADGVARRAAGRVRSWACAGCRWWATSGRAPRGAAGGAGRGRGGVPRGADGGGGEGHRTDHARNRMRREIWRGLTLRARFALRGAGARRSRSRRGGPSRKAQPEARRGVARQAVSSGLAGPRAKERDAVGHERPSGPTSSAGRQEELDDGVFGVRLGSRGLSCGGGGIERRSFARVVEDGARLGLRHLMLLGERAPSRPNTSKPTKIATDTGRARRGSGHLAGEHVVVRARADAVLGAVAVGALAAHRVEPAVVGEAATSPGRVGAHAAERRAILRRERRELGRTSSRRRRGRGLRPARGSRRSATGGRART